MTDGMSAPLAQSQLVEIIDNILSLDDTSDNGYIEYTEFVTAMRRNRARYSERLWGLSTTHDDWWRLCCVSVM